MSDRPSFYFCKRTFLLFDASYLQTKSKPWDQFLSTCLHKYQYSILFNTNEIIIHIQAGFNNSLVVNTHRNNLCLNFFDIN